MMNKEATEAMLLRKVFALREGILKGNLNSLWVDHMLQRTIENDHRGDHVLRSTFLTLLKPSLERIGVWIRQLEDGTLSNEHGPISQDMLNLLKIMHWGEGPDLIELTLVTKKNLFISDWNTEETEDLVLRRAKDALLTPCPDWVVPALVFQAMDSGLEPGAGLSLNFCLRRDEEREVGLAMFYRAKWHLHTRSLDRNCPWSTPMNWLFEKR